MDGAKFRAIAVFNQKGGISKTTTASNLAICLAALGRSVLLVDLDAQGDSTKSFLRDEPKVGVFDVLTGRARLEDAVVASPFPGLAVLPSTIDLAGIEFALADHQNSNRLLAGILAQYDIDCDYIVIDCPPALSVLPVNALTAAHSVVVPVTASPFATDGLLRTLPSVKYIQGGLNKRLRLHGILFTIVERGLSPHKIELATRKRMGDAVYASTIPKDRNVIAAAEAGLPVCVHAPGSRAGLAYADFAVEFLERQGDLRDLAPQAARERLTDRLAEWRDRIAPTLHGQAGGERQTRERRLRRALYGDADMGTRLHMSVVHFLIDHPLVAITLGGFTFTALGALLYALPQLMRASS